MNMEEYYDISIKGLHVFKKKYGRNPLIRQWDEYAMQENYLSSKSIKWISGKDFRNWCIQYKE